MAISSALGVILALNAALLFGFSSHVLVWAARVPAQVDTFNSVPPIDACSTHTRIGSIAPPSNAPQGSGAREPSNTTAPSGSPVRGRPRPAAAVNVTSEPLHFPEGGACLSRAINGTSPRPSTYWVQDIKRRGKAPFNASPETYTVYRNVKDFGARGDGLSDDTKAINAAILAGSRCGKDCDSSTTTPALVYFPRGTYVVTAPIIQLYYTQLVGDAVAPPVLKAASTFRGIAVIDSDPYTPDGANWYTNQNNFFRQVRNFVIDLTSMPPSAGAGIHWQVAQATSLQNIRFEMIRGGGQANKQQGIFMDNGSGGFMANLTFNGGNYGAFFGNQQFTTRDLIFNGCNTAIFMNWNWLWALKSISINNCSVGIDMSNFAPDTGELVGSVLLQDSKISNTAVGILSSWTAASLPTSGGTLVLDNVAFPNSPVAVSSAGVPVLPGKGVVKSWAQGREYFKGASNGTRKQGPLDPYKKPAALLDAQGTVFERTKPQYEDVPASRFLSIKGYGAKGDGVTDDTAVIQKVLSRACPDEIVHFDHGAYVVSDTIQVPKNIRITGEIWPVILAAGAAFGDPLKPKPVFRIGQEGDVGTVEISDMIFATVGPQPGAILMEWNVFGQSQGATGIWDVHFRIGGAAGTDLQSDTCLKAPGGNTTANLECQASFLLMHVTKSASLYQENCWFWVADHDLDLVPHDQITLFNGRGVLVESQGPVWMYGTASEHSQIYQYSLHGAKDVFMSAIQTETPYYQASPNALTPFRTSAAYGDPDFSSCTTDSCRKAWGLVISNSTDVLVYGAGLYSFFDEYGQDCLATESCQENVALIVDSPRVGLYGFSTKAATNMISLADGVVPQRLNRNGFCSTLAVFKSS